MAGVSAFGAAAGAGAGVCARDGVAATAGATAGAGAGAGAAVCAIAAAAKRLLKMKIVDLITLSLWVKLMEVNHDWIIVNRPA